MPVGGAIAEADLAPLSALQHFLYCPRQCALIHIERIWVENTATAEGRAIHERVQEESVEQLRGVRTVTAMPLRSLRLGVAGIADVVELRHRSGAWHPYPVEYKRGRPKSHRADEVQLCAQAMCLEEMFGTSIEEGALFYGEPRRRTPISFDAELRALTGMVASMVRGQFRAMRTPPARYDKARCDGCSLISACRPRLAATQKSAREWLASVLAGE